VAKDEFVEIDLELIAAHTVISSDQPLLQVADRAVSPIVNITQRLSRPIYFHFHSYSFLLMFAHRSVTDKLKPFVDRWQRQLVGFKP
jgi:hypothetical protein